MRWTLLLICFTLSACGFHLRNHHNFSSTLQPIIVESDTHDSLLTRQLMARLSSHTHHAKKPYVLVLSNEKKHLTLTGNSSTTQVKQYQLSCQVTFSLISPTGETLIPAQTVSATQSLIINADAMLASDSQAAYVTQNVTQSLISKLLQRLNAQNQLAHEN